MQSPISRFNCNVCKQSFLIYLVSHLSSFCLGTEQISPRRLFPVFLILLTVSQSSVLAFLTSVFCTNNEESLLASASLLPLLSAFKHDNLKRGGCFCILNPAPLPSQNKTKQRVWVHVQILHRNSSLASSNCHFQKLKGITDGVSKFPSQRTGPEQD